MQCEFNALLDAAVHKKSDATCETPNSLTFSASQMEVETSLAFGFPHFLGELFYSSHKQCHAHKSECSHSKKKKTQYSITFYTTNDLNIIFYKCHIKS